MQGGPLTIIIIYFVIIFVLGIWASRFIKDSTDFLLAGRRLGVLMAAATLAATHFGGGFVMGGGQSGFENGLSGMAYAIGCGLGLVALGLVAARPMRKLSLYTVPDFLEMRYQSKFVRFLGAALSLVAIAGIVAAQVGASRGALSILGIAPETGAIVATVLFILYTTISGMWGVTLTDSLQLLIIIIGVPLAAILGVQAAGGWSAMRESVSVLEVSGGVETFFSPVGMGTFTIMAVIIPTVMYSLIGQDFYQRLFAARDEKTAFNAAILAGLLLIIFGAFPAIAGMASRAIFGELEVTSQAIPMIVMNVLPLGIAAIVVGAILAAVMSTADSLLVAGTSHITNDFYVKLLNPGAEGDTKKLLLISRIGTVVLGGIALLLALAIPGIISMLILSYTMYASALFVPVILGIYWKRATAAGAVAGIISGSLAALAGALGWLSYGGAPVIIVGGLVSLVFFVVFSLFTTPPPFEG